MLTANAAGNSASPALFVATTPCRLIDTRVAAETVGARAVPLGANDTYTTVVLGTHGRCTVPADAATLVMNVTATNQTASSFLTVFQAGSTRPTTSNLNWDTASGDIANAVTASVSDSGELSFYNLAGSTDIVADVVGYYTSVPLENYYTKAQVDALIAANPAGVGPVGDAGPRGPAGIDGIDGNDGATGPQGEPGSGEAPKYSYAVIGASGMPYIMFDLGVPDLEFYARCDSMGGGGTIDAGVHIWNGTGEPAVVVLEDGTTVTLGMFDATEPVNGSFGSRAGMKSSTVITRGTHAWEVNVSIDIEPADGTCRVHSVVTTLEMVTIGA
jgi:hypothetical protein